MKAKVYFKTEKAEGSFVVEEHAYTFKQWCEGVGKAHSANGYFCGDRIAFPVRCIAQIENLED